MRFLMPPHPLKKIEMQKYYQDEPKSNGIFSRNNLPKKAEDGACVINLDEYADVWTHWIALFFNRSETFISIVLVLNMFLKKLHNLLGLKTSKETSFE